MPKDMINVVYTIKNDGRDIKKLAHNIAVGQTIGIWNELSGNVRLQISKHLAEVVSIEESSFTSTVKIAFPIENFGSDLGALLTAVYGKISLVPKIKLEDIEFSQNYLNLFKGPRFGISGIRDQLGKKEKPLLMSIFKPCLGLSHGELGNMFYEQAEAGIDIVKDDEILYDKDFNQTLKRLEACLGAKEKAKAKTIYAINLTGQANEILDRAVQLEKNGALCILFNYVSYGLPLLTSLRQTVSIPIMAHPAFAGAICMGSTSGLSEQLLLAKLPRIAGADFVLFPSQYGSLSWEKNIVLSINKELTKPLIHIKPSWPVPSAGIKANMVKEIILDFGEDIVINAGTAVWEHKDGGLAGAKEFIKEVESLNLVSPRSS
ncbi:MAG: 2,3-diketo-5-methylthiopentyl-1-phosphate enolase [Candidatus Melainabacteria bacterium]|nr:2,3-diketo-5-methylthiopentyl-1-phosphate enolase [Candidatus Melainabacteria bacterium]